MLGFGDGVRGGDRISGARPWSCAGRDAGTAGCGIVGSEESGPAADAGVDGSAEAGAVRDDTGAGAPVSVTVRPTSGGGFATTLSGGRVRSLPHHRHFSA